ncbi:MAG: Activating signal cointegrator 1, variant 2, partial [Marteilia pararefringens]
GRHICNCEASYHRLVSNCLNCGRIVCTQEGIGNCFTCGQYVSSIEERRSKLPSKSSQQLGHRTKESDLGRNTGENLDKAIKLKNDLLIQNSSANATVVLDDQLDYFQTQSNFWTSPKNKELLQQQIEELQINHQEAVDIEQRTLHPFRSPRPGQQSIDEDLAAQQHSLYDKIQLAIATCDASNLEKMNHSNPMRDYIDYQIYSKNLLNTMQSHDQLIKQIRGKKYMRYTLNAPPNFDFKQSKTVLQTHTATDAICLPQPLANLICLSQVSELDLSVIIGVAEQCNLIEEETPYWIVSSSNYIPLADAEENSDSPNSRIRQRMVNMNIDKYLMQKHCRPKHIIGRAIFAYSKEIPLTNSAEKVPRCLLLDSLFLDLPIPYDDRDRGICN